MIPHLLIFEAEQIVNAAPETAKVSSTLYAGQAESFPEKAAPYQPPNRIAVPKIPRKPTPSIRTSKNGPQSSQGKVPIATPPENPAPKVIARTAPQSDIMEAEKQVKGSPIDGPVAKTIEEWKAQGGKGNELPSPEDQISKRVAPSGRPPVMSGNVVDANPPNIQTATKSMLLTFGSPQQMMRALSDYNGGYYVDGHSNLYQLDYKGDIIQQYDPLYSALLGLKPQQSSKQPSDKAVRFISGGPA